MIDRVSALFRGNPALIQGFNTFLPPGYHIDFYTSSTDPGAAGFIYVTTPSGTTRSQANHGTNLTGLNGPRMEMTHMPIPPHGGGGAGAAPAQLEPAHAVAFLDKMCNVLRNSPDVFTVTLEVFRYWERDNRSVPAVRRRNARRIGLTAQLVEILSNLLRPASGNELIEDLKVFMPDNSNPNVPASTSPGYALLGQAAMTYTNRPPPLPQARGGSRQQPQPQPQPDHAHGPSHRRPPPVPTSQPKKRRQASTTGQQAPTAAALPGTTAARFLNQPVAGPVDSPPKAKRTKLSASAAAANEAPSVQLPVAGRPQATPEEAAFFDRVSRWLDDRAAYHELLKTLNLYTHSAIALPELVERAHLFLGASKELWRAFCDLVGWKEGMVDHARRRVDADGRWIVENVPTVERGRVDLAEAPSYGSTYRKLPSGPSPSCSGRDALCWAVLNDEWVATPSAAQRRPLLEPAAPPSKNAYELALNRSEDERFEYDYHIEAVLRTIALLEPLHTRIATMEPEEKAHFRLKPGLGGQSKSIYTGLCVSTQLDAELTA